MGLDLTQEQINQLFASHERLGQQMTSHATKLDEQRRSIDRLDVRLATLDKTVERFEAKLDNGLAGRVRRMEYIAIGTVALISVSAGPGVSWLVSAVLRIVP